MRDTTRSDKSKYYPREHPLHGCYLKLTVSASSVIALSKLYSLNDQRVAQVSVKGDLIVSSNDGQIKTRSRAKQSTLRSQGDFFYGDLEEAYRQFKDGPTDSAKSTADPDQYTIIPAPLKIIKLLIDELQAASGVGAAANAASAAVASTELDSDDDDEGWEDDDDTLDMGLASTKADLMSFIEGPGRRQPDDETQNFLTEFFLICGREDTASFKEWYNMLSEEEKQKLNELAN